MFTETGEYGPVLESGLDENTMGLRHQRFTKSKDFGEIAGLGENSGMGCNLDEPAQDLRRDTIAGVTVDDSVKPTSTTIVIAGIRSKGVYQNMDIREDHRFSIRSSRSLDRLRSTPGSVPPEALEIGNRTRVRRRGFDSVSTVFKPSSMREVSVRPCSAAFFLALRKRSSDSRIVVLICQSISSEHQYVDLAMPSKNGTLDPTLRANGSEAIESARSGSRPRGRKDHHRKHEGHDGAVIECRTD